MKEMTATPNHTELVSPLDWATQHSTALFPNNQKVPLLEQPETTAGGYIQNQVPPQVVKVMFLLLL